MVRRRSIATYGHGNGLFCQGALQEVSKCSLGEAEPTACGEGPSVDCELSTWSEWSSCSASCDGGEMRRSRHITQHPIRGETCQGRLEEVKECARDHCGGGNPVDCVYGEWKEWAACLKCSGERKRLRHILVYPAEGGRKILYMGHLVKLGRMLHDMWAGRKAKADARNDRGRETGELGQSRSAAEDRRGEDRLGASESSRGEEIVLAFTAGFLALFAVGGFSLRRVRRDPSEDLRDPEAQVSDSERPFLPVRTWIEVIDLPGNRANGDQKWWRDEEMLGDGYAAAERIALEPNGNPNYLIDPNNANFFHMMYGAVGVGIIPDSLATIRYLEAAKAGREEKGSAPKEVPPSETKSGALFKDGKKKKKLSIPEALRKIQELNLPRDPLEETWS
eukprot:g8903.t1